MRPATRVQTVTADGIRLAGRLWRPDSGSVSGDGGPHYVVAHGFTGSTRARRVQAICSRLAWSGSGVVAFDFRGHGDSAGASTLGDVETRDVAAAVAFARRTFDGPVVTAGWSMGGSVVLRHAGLGGDTDAVVAVSSPGIWYERSTRAMRLVHWTAETRRGRLGCRLLLGTRLTTGWETLPESPVEVVAAIAPRPLLVVHGDEDPYFPLRHAQLLAAAAPGADFWLEPGMGHAETATGSDLLDRIAAWARHRLLFVGGLDSPPESPLTGSPTLG